jgi:uncharacterized protein YhjY with autotransporter beta-barrel domain
MFPQIKCACVTLCDAHEVACVMAGGLSPRRRKLAIVLLTLLASNMPPFGAPGAVAQTAATPPTVSSIRFSPATANSGSTSTLTITLGNANAGAATLTQTLTDVFPAGMTLANATVGGSCTSSAVGATAGAGSVSYGTGATIPPGGCAFSVNVKAASSTTKTYYTDTIPAGALQTNLGNSPAGASGTLTVQAAVHVPNVVGLLQNAAATALQAAGLVVGTVTTSQGPPNLYNEVFKQTPAAGTSVAQGTAITLVISIGNASNPNAPLSSAANGLTPGQQSLAAALERLCAKLQAEQPTTTARHNLLANCLAVIATHGGGNDPSGLAGTLNALSGMQTTGQQTTGLDFGGTQFTNISTRLTQLRQGLGGSPFSAVDVGLPGNAGLGQLFALLKDALGISAPSDDGGGGSGDADDSNRGGPGRWGFFLNGNLRRGTQDNTLNQTGFDFKSTGLTAGADYRLTDHLVLGAAIGHSNGDADFADGSAQLDSHTTTGSLYATYYNQSFYVDLIGTYGHVGYNEQRTTSFSIDPSVSPLLPSNCTVSGLCTDDTNGSTAGRQLSFGANAGYSFYRGGLGFGPDLALSYTHLHVDGFSENDPDVRGLALVYDDQIGESLLLKAGGHLSYAISTPFAVILPQVRAHYIHEFKNDDRALSVHFLDDPTINTPTGPVSSFVVFTDQPQRDYLEYAVDLTMQFTYGFSAFVDYSSLANDGAIRSHELTLGVRVQTGLLSGD